MDEGLRELFELLPRATPSERELITRAHAFAAAAHKDQRRESGVPYLTHLVATAHNLARFGADVPTIAAGLLHDTIEDTRATDDDIRREFGDEILFLVNGVTKLGKLKYRGLKRHVETLRKLFVATAADTRVILIKLADRLHNLRTIEALARDKQLRIANEALEIFAPIAHRLGMGKLKAEIEDAAFGVIDPAGHNAAQQLREQKSKETAEELSRFVTDVRAKLVDASIEVESIDSRLKHLYSLHKKIVEKGRDIDDVHDVAAIRIVVPTVEDCYLTLGIIHASWTPLPGRIKDYIAIPKPNGYQSLHTSVFTGEGAVVEVQIRTREMHDNAERGAASHVAYKERDAKASHEIDELRKLVEMPSTKTRTWLFELAAHKPSGRDDDYLHELKSDFFKDRIVVFTPKGEAIDLPMDATPIDFAYAIHSDLGDHASGARINGKFTALDTPLKHGDIVLIETNEHNKPSAKWLQIAVTTSAKRKIRAALGMVES